MLTWGHLGSQWSNFDFHLKCNNSSIFHSIFMLLIQMHKLETLNLLWGVKSQSGVIWGHRGQILIFTKNALPLLCYQVYSCNSYTCITFAGKQGNWGQSGVDVSKPAGYAVCDGNMSSFFFFILPAQPQDLVSYSFLLFFFSSSFFFFLLLATHRFSHISLHPILTKLGHNDWYLDHYSGTKDGGVRGHHGVTGVKKVICTKKASSPSDYVALTRDLCICSSLTPSTKVMVLKNCQGSFGVTGVKSSFSQKRHQVLQIM